jgi:hypothetical protein
MSCIANQLNLDFCAISHIHIYRAIISKHKPLTDQQTLKSAVNLVRKVGTCIAEGQSVDFEIEAAQYQFRCIHCWSQATWKLIWRSCLCIRVLYPPINQEWWPKYRLACPTRLIAQQGLSVAYILTIGPSGANFEQRRACVYPLTRDSYPSCRCFKIHFLQYEHTHSMKHNPSWESISYAKYLRAWATSRYKWKERRKGKEGSKTPYAVRIVPGACGIALPMSLDRHAIFTYGQLVVVHGATVR